MIVVGLAGGIGCGKSEVARIMADLGAVVIDADKYGHQVYAPNTQGWTEVVAAFGDDILDDNGEVDRRKLGPKVFGKPEEMQKLNDIAWPKIKQSIQEEIENQRRTGTGVVVVDAAILIEAGWTDLSDQVWVATAPEEQVIKRVQARNNITEEQVKARIDSQMGTDERVSYADVVVSNDQDLDALKDNVVALWEQHLGEK
ncbi:MAG: dephospho-CoA kinase [Dehalococcoidia bacterium]|nr:dephospho-CoA kinase [Dehalococcoidia bacterium]MQF99245.1 dephospho-CoA kinase [SAR202 cluster bacterium]|tara:strand:+ start:182 stop:781 length:600 start_codon:yes stop_codon:yes gene_type:complete